MRNKYKLRTTMMHRFWKHVADQPEKIGFIVQQKAKEPTISNPARGDPVVRYEEKTWEQAGYIIAAIMVILETEIGLQSGDRAAIISWNRPEWSWINMAIWTLGGISVGIDPRYATDQVCHIINDANRSDDLPNTGMRVVFVEDESQAAKLVADKLDAPDIKVVLIADLMKRIEDSELDVDESQCELSTLAMLSMESIAEYLSGIQPEQIAMLLYTSGSTGEPKGVILTHQNIVFMSNLISRRVKLNEHDLFLGQLPANHIFVWNGMGPCMWNGIPSFYCHPLEMKKHLKTLHPTIVFGVPKVWQAIVNEVKKDPQLTLPFLPRAQVKTINRVLGQAKSNLIKRALEPEKSRFNRMANRVVCGRLKAALGGRLRLPISGGAALPEDVAKLFSVCDLDIMNGYGATETTGSVSVETQEERSPGSAGKLLDLVEVEFEPTEEDQGPNSGILLIGGPTISPGYWNKPDETEEAFKNGKFRSGDKAYIDAKGFLFIGDRESDDGKLGNGEKVSSREIADFFRYSPLIEYIVPIFMNRPVVKALVFLKESAARHYLVQQGAVEQGADCPVEFLAKQELIVQAVRAEIAAINDKLGLKGEWKRIRDFEIVPETPTTANGLLTVKMEVSAKKAMARFSDLVELMYGRYSSYLNAPK